MIKPTYKPQIQIIPAVLINIASKKFTEIKQMVSEIKAETSVQIKSVTVQQYQHAKIYTTISVNP